MGTPQDECNLPILLLKEFGTDYDQFKIQRASKIEKRMHKEHERLCDKVEAGEFDGEEFAHKFNNLANKYLKLLGQVIGPEDYQHVFKVPFGAPVTLVYPVLAKKVDYTQKQ